MAFGAFAPLAFAAGPKLDLQSMATLREMRMAPAIRSHSPAGRQLAFGQTASGCVTVMVSLADGYTTDELEAEGAEVVRELRGGFALVSLPLGDVERMSELKSVARMQLMRPLSAEMDVARPASGVAPVHSGTGLPQAYTGKGVVAGIVDGGMDPNHINFRNADGSSRISQLGHLTLGQSATNPVMAVYYDPSNIGTFLTDDVASYHGTHTMGIMAGGYRGQSTVALTDDSGAAAEVQTIDNPYYGVAYDADIVASCGDLYDGMIAYGIDDILDYADRAGKPAVINLSLGNNVGGHDGTDVIHQYLNAVAKADNAIICVAAGNDGDLPIALNRTLTASGNELKTFVRPYVYEDMRYGSVSIYSNDATEFSVAAVVFNRERERVAYEMTFDADPSGATHYWITSADYQQSQDDELSAELAKHFDGYVGLGTQLDENSGRYYATVNYLLIDNEENDAAGFPYIFGLVVTGKDGQRIDCFCDGTFTALDGYGIDGWADGDFNGSISDMACANDVLVVGSYNSRDTYPSLDGNVYGYPGIFPPGKISSFSSYGTLIDGRNLPHVCAPGATVVSSISTPFVNASSGVHLMAKVSGDTRTDYWGQSYGTSMATPYVTGAIATWLEANPDLTIDDVKKIVAKTAVRDEDVAAGDPVQWGAGKFDAYAGLKEALRLTGGIGEPISEAVAGGVLLVKPVGDRGFNVFLAGADRLDAVLFDVAGTPVARQSAVGDELTLSAAGIIPGVYILNVNGRYSQRILLR